METKVWTSNTGTSRLIALAEDGLLIANPGLFETPRLARLLRDGEPAETVLGSATLRIGLDAIVEATYVTGTKEVAVRALAEEGGMIDHVLFLSSPARSLDAIESLAARRTDLSLSKKAGAKHGSGAVAVIATAVAFVVFFLIVLSGQSVGTRDHVSHGRGLGALLVAVSLVAGRWAPFLIPAVAAAFVLIRYRPRSDPAIYTLRRPLHAVIRSAREQSKKRTRGEQSAPASPEPLLGVPERSALAFAAAPAATELAVATPATPVETFSLVLAYPNPP